jgi:hypothetical protein
VFQRQTLEGLPFFSGGRYPRASRPSARTRRAGPPRPSTPRPRTALGRSASRSPTTPPRTMVTDPRGYAEEFSFLEKHQLQTAHAAQAPAGQQDAVPGLRCAEQRDEPHRRARPRDQLRLERRRPDDLARGGPGHAPGAHDGRLSRPDFGPSQADHAPEGPPARGPERHFSSIPVFSRSSFASYRKSLFLVECRFGCPLGCGGAPCARQQTGFGNSAASLSA